MAPSCLPAGALGKVKKAMVQRVLIAGGYGAVGSTIARYLRRLAPDLEIILAGRSPESGAELAREIGATTLRLDAATVPHKIRWEWTRGHAGHAENERVDELARKGLREHGRGLAPVES